MKLGLGFKTAGFMSILILLIGIGLFGLVIYEEKVTIHELRIEESFQYARKTSSLVDDKLYALDIRGLRQVVSSIMESGRVDLVWVLDEDGRLLADGSDKPALRNQKPPIPFIDTLMASKIESTAEDETYHWVGVPVTLPNDTLLGYVVVAFNEAYTDERLRSKLVSQFIILGLTLFIGVLGAFFFGRWITTSLATVSSAAEQVGAGNWDIKIDISSQDEIGELARNINAMAKNLSGIAVSRDNLEVIVEEKTAELIKHRELLKEEVEIRTRELSKALEEAEAANHAKSDFLAGMSHELRTPLTSSLGSLGLLSSLFSEDFSEQGREFLEMAIRNNKALLRLVNELLDFEKILSGTLIIETSKHDICALTTNAIKDLQGYAQTQSVNFVFNEPTGPVFSDIHEHRFEQIIYNLLSNAAKFSESGSDVNISINSKNEHIFVSVEDKGPGIPEKFRDKIFEHFTQADMSSTRQHSGTGLGLAISKALAEGMGGTIGFETEVGVGSTFIITLTASK